MKCFSTKRNYRTIKYLSTTDKDKKEAKGKDREEVEFLENSFFVPTMKTILFRLMKKKFGSGLSKLNL
jgi:hypothetical protein